MTAQPIDVVRTYVDASNDRSLADDAEAIFAPDLVLRNEASGMEVEGLDAFLQHTVHGWLTAVPDARVELLDYQVDGRTVDCEMRSTGTFEGELETPEGTIPGTGESFEMTFRVAATVEDGRITRWVSDLDLAEWMAQVGIADEAEARSAEDLADTEQ